MKKTFLIFIVLCATVFTVAQAKQNLDNIVAVINDDVVTATELKHALALVKMQMSQEKIPEPAENELRKQVLNQIVNKKLQLQIASQAGVTTSEKELEEAISNIAKQNNVSTEELYQRLSMDGMSKKDYRQEMRDQLTLHKLQQAEVVNRVRVSKQEIKSFMKSPMWQDNSTNEYHIEDILVPLAETPTANDIASAKQQAQTVVAKLKQGEIFSQLAQSQLGKKLNLQMSDLGWLRLAEIPTAFADQVVHLQAKEIADPIRTPNGFHVIRLAAVRSTEVSKATLSEKQIENLLLQRKFEEAVKTWVVKLRAQAFITIDGEKVTA